MIHYNISSKKPTSHYIDIELIISNNSSQTLELQLPAWRPGRYELGNFAKNIKKVIVLGEHKQPLQYKKNSKDLWEIESLNNQTITVSYSYFTSEINAGNCYVDETQLYVNPVHLCLYAPQRMNEQHTVSLDIPQHYKIASSLPISNNTITAKSFDELADAPFMASTQLQSDNYELDGVKFWLHFNGECKPDFEKLKNDFIKFTQTQLRFWGDFPVKEYHFLFQILPFKFYHGVEHQHSTVIALGPGYNINNGSTYESLLGVSSHELFHTWNIKYIRPLEMLPYDFTKENYARTGFVYEGFTTYYGDLLLLTSAVFTTQQYFETLEERLQKHFHNYGRFNLSVADSSWDTWLDGYVPGAPYRKTSIYDEGNLIAFMLDVLIMKYSQNQKGLRDVCRILYHEFGKKQKGYSEQDIIEICETLTNTSFKLFFENYVYGTENYEPELKQCFDYLGIHFYQQQSTFICERYYGFKTVDFNNNRKISMIAPDSPAWDANLSIGDEILSVNGFTLKNDFNDWMNYFKHETITLTFSSNQVIKQILLANNLDKKSYFDVPKITLKEGDQSNFNEWMKLNS